MGISVTGLSITPIKGTRVRAVDDIRLDRFGVRENRRFYVIDHRDHLVNGKRLGELTALVSDYDHERRRLRLEFPDGTVLEDTIGNGPLVKTRFFSQESLARLVDGPWSDALTGYSGHPLRLVEAQSVGVDRGMAGVASLISRASLGRLAREADRDEIDCRRFRMLIEIDGIDAHAEDRWVGQTTNVGDATIRWRGHVGRCLTTSRDPDSGDIDLPTLEMLRNYRAELESTEPLPFGIYGEVLQGGTVAVGDRVAVVE
jgi:MOSC domain-containing protein